MLNTDEMFIAECTVLGEDGMSALSRKEEFEAQEAGLPRKNTSMETLALPQVYVPS